MGKAVKGLDIKNSLITLTGNKSDLKKLNNLKEQLQKNGYSTVTITVNTYNEDKKYKDKAFHFNATIAAVKQD